MPDASRAKRFVAGVYSFAAKRIYEPLVVKGAFPLTGGRINSLALAQGRRAVASASGKPLLDMPVGTAFFTVQLAPEHDGLVVGADIATGMVERTKAEADARGIANISAIQADAHHLPFRDGAFGSVLSTNGLQVIPGLRPSVRELVRVLAPGGRLYVSVISLPVGKLLPRRKERLPTIMRSGADVAAEISRAGAEVASIERERLATLIEAVKR